MGRGEALSPPSCFLQLSQQKQITDQIRTVLLLPSAVTAENSPVSAKVEMLQELTWVARSEPQLGVWWRGGHPKSTGQLPWDKPETCLFVTVSGKAPRTRSLLQVDTSKALVVAVARGDAEVPKLQPSALLRGQASAPARRDPTVTRAEHQY